MVAPWVPATFVALGTDGFGRSDTRESLRAFFEIDAAHIAAATMSALARDGEITREAGRRGDQGPRDRPGQGGPGGRSEAAPRRDGGIAPR